MTGQSLLDLMEVANPELQLQSTEDDVAKGLLALNAAQDAFEALVARYPGVLGGQVGTVTTSGSTETTAFPTGLLRVDSLWYVNPTTSRPQWKLKPLYESGEHVTSTPWPYLASSSGSSGKPTAYWTNGTNIYWAPLPDATHTVRWVGFNDADAITASGTFAYPDHVAFPMAVLAVKFIKVGLDDDAAQFQTISKDLFEPLVETLSGFRREQGRGLQYFYRHDT